MSGRFSPEPACRPHVNHGSFRSSPTIITYPGHSAGSFRSSPDVTGHEGSFRASPSYGTHVNQFGLRESSDDDEPREPKAEPIAMRPWENPNLSIDAYGRLVPTEDAIASYCACGLNGSPRRFYRGPY